MKRTAIISDVHSNIEALEAVLDDVHEHECEEILCLGDLLGYGPSPRQVLKIAMDLFELCWHDVREALSDGQVHHRLAVFARQVTTRVVTRS